MRNQRLIPRGMGLCLFLLLLIPAAALFAGATPSGPNVQVTDQGLGDDDAEEPSIAVVGSTVYAVWQDERDEDTWDTNGAVYFAKSTDGGQTWGDNVRVTDPTYDKWADDPEIAVQPDGTIWVIWFQLYRENSNKVNDIRFAISTDGGESFNNQGTVLVNGFDSNETGWRPDIVADENGVYVLYRYYSCSGSCNSSSQEGYTISLKAINTQSAAVETVQISDSRYNGRFTSGGLDNGPKVDLDLNNGLICAAWEDARDQAIYGACSQDQGQTFGSNFNISPTDAENPSLAVGPDGTLYATYSLEDDSNHNIWLRVSKDQGQTWSTPAKLTNQDIWDVEYWDLDVDSAGQLLLAWVVEEGTFSTDLFFSTSIDEGANWSTIAVEDGQGEFASTSDHTAPTVVTNKLNGNDYAYVAWSDDRSSDDQIWFSRLLLDNVPPAAPVNLKAEAAAGTIQLTWEPSGSGTDTAGYHVYRSTSASGSFNRINLLMVQPTSYADLELPAGTTFFYKIAAVDSTGNVGPLSVAVSGAAGENNNTSIYGTIAYESGSEVRLRELTNGQETIIADSRSPLFSNSGDAFYHVQGDSIYKRSVSGASPAVFRTFGNAAENVFITEFDIATNNKVGVIQYRQFVSAGPSPLRIVTEPRVYSDSSQLEYVDEYVFGSEVAISADSRWLAYRTTGFCNVAVTGTYSPPRFCMADLSNNSENCIEGADYRDPDFAPSVNSIVFGAPITGQYEIWKAQVESDGRLTNYVQLTSGGANTPSRNPSWSTDGNWIVFQRDVDPTEEEDWQLRVVRADGVGNQPLGVSGEEPVWYGGGNAAPVTGLVNRTFLPFIER